MQSRNSIPVNTVLFRKLSRILTPDEISIYLAVKLLVIKNKKIPSLPQIIDVMGPKAPGVIRKMKKRGVIPKGKIDLSQLDNWIQKNKSGFIIETPKASHKKFASEAKILVLYFYNKFKHMNISFTKQWFASQHRQALELLQNQNISMDKWKAIIDWALDDNFYKSRTTSLYHVSLLVPKYELRSHGKGHSQATRMHSKQSHEDFWQRSAV